jgi:hypothetical protein
MSEVMIVCNLSRPVTVAQVAAAGQGRGFGR